MPPNPADEERTEALRIDLVLDRTKLAAAVKKGEADVYILQWLARAEIALQDVDQDYIQSKQQSIESDLLSIVYAAQPEQAGNAIASTAASSSSQANTPSTAVTPGRPVRHLIARCFIILIGRGESRSLFDVIQTLLRVGADERQKTVTSSPSKEARVAALYILGELFGKMGDQVMSHFLEITVVMQRLFKASALPPILRYHALQALQKALLVGGRSLNDQPGKELLKGLRQGLTDPAAAVVRGCADCITALLEKTDFLSTRVEIELSVSTGLKALEIADFVTKRSLSNMCAALLAYTQVENSAPIPPPSKKVKKKKADGAEDDSDDEEASQQAAASAALAAADGGPGRTLMSAVTMLDQISQSFLRQNTSRKGRVAFFDVYASLLSTLGHEWVLRHYSTLVRHFMDSLPNHIRGIANRAEGLFVRTGVGIIIRNLIGERMLDEQAQVAAIQEISSLYLNRWPALMPGQSPPSKYTLVIAFNECSGLLAQLGSAPPQVQEAVYEATKRSLGHASHSVQVAATWCLRTLCDVHPLLLSGTITSTLESLSKDLDALSIGGGKSGAEVSRRARGRAVGLAALVNVIPRRPLYVSFEVCSRVIDLAMKLLKESGNNDLAISAVQIQVAWTLVGSLMSLGPNFVRLYLNQLLTLWRNGLPKPTAADAGQSSRSDAEWGFLLHVRECTLSALLPFLTHNAASLVTLDTARRLVVLLSNTLAFVNNFTAQHPHIAQEQVPGTELNSLTLLDREQLLRRRLLQCFVALANNPAMEVLRGSMISVATQVFAEPDRYIGSAAQAAIAASAGGYSSVWAFNDGYAFGVTSLQRDDETFVSASDDVNTTYPATAALTRADWLNRDAVEVQLDALQRRPVLGAAEHDLLCLYSAPSTRSLPSQMILEVPGTSPLPPPPATGVVDAAIELFAALLPSEERDTQISTLETLLAYCRSPKLEKNPGRKMAIQVNACVAVLGVLRAAARGAALGRKVGGFNNHRVSTALQEIIRIGLLHRDSVLRAVGSVAYGRLAASSGSHAMSAQVRFLVDTIVSNRDPDARAGCALAFGAIYGEVGGLAAVPLKEEVLNVLMSLATDPHPTVHYYALQALRMVVDAASLSYSPFVGSTLGMLVKLYMLDTHESEGGSAGSIALRADTPALQAACSVITALIGVLGPDLNESTRTRTLIVTLLLEFSAETDDGIVVEALKARQNFGLFAESHVDTTAWIEQLSKRIRSPKRPVQVAATNAFYQLVQRQALAMSKIGGDRLVESLFAQLDSDPNIEGIREVIMSWLQQTADLSPLGWIDLCKRIMTHTVGQHPVKMMKSAAPKGNANAALQDEESATLDLGEGTGSQAAGVRTSRWRTQLFALRCLHEVFLTVRRSGRIEHFATPVAGSTTNKAALMSSRVGELIKVAFTASTAANAEIRLEGLTILRDVIDSFKLARDPEFADALLLEQHQAPIAAALTPAFLADSTPEVLASAIEVCATFVGSGVVREVDRMGRILKQLVSAIEACKEPTMSRLGDVFDLSPNASAMLKVAVFSAWAELQVASAKQPYLVRVVEPHVKDLTPFWIASLREYARIKGDPEGAGIGGAGPGPIVNPSLDSQYASLAREAIMPYYDRSWHKLLEAVGMLMEQDVTFIRHALNGEPLDVENRPNGTAASADEPSLFFFVLYGLAFEALTTGPSTVGGRNDADAATRRTRIMATALQAMRNLTRSQYAGSALLIDGFFDEWCNLASRLAMTEPATVQLRVVEMVAAFAASHNQRLLADDVRNAVFSAQSKLTRCLRIVIYALGRGLRSGDGLVEKKAAVVRAAYSAFISITLLYPAEFHEELFAVGFHTWADMLRAEGPELDLVGLALPSLKALCETAPLFSKSGSDVLTRVVHGFLSTALQNVDDMRTRAGRVADLKTRNSLLAVTVVLTSLPPSGVVVHASVAEHLCFLLTQKTLEAIKEDTDTSVVASGMIALNCMRSLIMATVRSTTMSQYCVGQLLPGLIEIVAKTAIPLLAQSEGTDPRLAFAEETMKALMAIITVSGDSSRAPILSIVLPAFILFLNPDASSSTNPPCHTASLGHLVSLASTQPQAFRTAMATLDGARRVLLEASIRSALTSGAASRAQEAAAPKAEASISLRSFGN